MPSFQELEFRERREKARSSPFRHSSSAAAALPLLRQRMAGVTRLAQQKIGRERAWSNVCKICFWSSCCCSFTEPCPREFFIRKLKTAGISMSPDVRDLLGETGKGGHERESLGKRVEEWIGWEKTQLTREGQTGLLFSFFSGRYHASHAIHSQHSFAVQLCLLPNPPPFSLLFPPPKGHAC